LGRHAPQRQFPLLFKFLDAHRNLSVQVHPNDQQAARLDPPDLGKTEAWVVLHAEPGSVIYAGLKRGFDRHAFHRELSRGTAELCLHQVEPRRGDCLFIPAGTVHAIGAGLIVAEIQQASDTTFRLYDWNRLGPDGRPRPLHLAEGLDATDFDRGPVSPQQPQPTQHPDCRRLVACDKFVLDRWELGAPDSLGGDDRCHLLVVIQGTCRVADDPAPSPLSTGQCVLLPASCGPVGVQPEPSATLLDCYLP
jgi:mannose-6-phosphate isomerase